METDGKPNVPRAWQTRCMKTTARFLPILAFALCITRLVNAEDLFPKLAELPKAAPGRDPFLKERGAPATAPAMNENLMAATVVFETYTVDLEDAASLLLSAPDSGARYRRVQDLVAGGKARLDNVIASASKPGQRTLVQSMDMIFRPWVWESAEVQDEAAVATVMQQWSAADRLEFEALLSADGRGCNLNFGLGASRVIGWRGFRASPQMLPQPGARTEVCDLTTSVVMRTGEPALLGTLTPSITAQPENRERTLVFGRVLTSRERPEAPAPEVTSLGHCEHLISIYSMDRTAARDVIAKEAKLGGIHAAVQALVGNGQAKLERICSLPSQPGMRAKLDEGVIGRQPGSISPVPVIGAPRDEQSKRQLDVFPSKSQIASSAPWSRSVVGKDFGLNVELESVVGPADALLKGIPLVVDLNVAIRWRVDRGILKAAEGVPLYVQTSVQEIRGLDTSASCYAGVNTFLGTLNPPRATGVNDRKDTGQAWLAFIRVTPVKQ